MTQFEAEPGLFCRCLKITILNETVPQLYGPSLKTRSIQITRVSR